MSKEREMLLELESALARYQGLVVKYETLEDSPECTTLYELDNARLDVINAAEELENIANDIKNKLGLPLKMGDAPLLHYLRG